MAAVRNASLSYTIDSTNFRQELFVMDLEQTHELSGTTAQSRLYRQFYPRAYAPGDMKVSGRCRSQEEYQQLGLFIREHQRRLLDSPANVMFNRADLTNPGYQRLLRLSVPSEGIILRGYVQRFTISKRGVHDPAPEYSFDFVVVFDPHAIDIEASSVIQQYFTEVDRAVAPVVSRRGIAEQKDPSDDPSIIDIIDMPTIPGELPRPGETGESTD